MFKRRQLPPDLVNIINWRDPSDIQSVVDYLTKPISAACDLHILGIRLQMLLELMLYLNKIGLFSFDIDTGKNPTVLTQSHIHIFKKQLDKTDEFIRQQLVNDYLTAVNTSLERQLQLKLVPPKPSAFSLVSYFTDVEPPLIENPIKLINLLMTSKAQMQAHLDVLRPRRNAVNP